MFGVIQASSTAIVNYGKDMSRVSDRISRAFQENSDVSVETELAKSMLIEHGLSANINTVRTQDEMLGSVLDMMA